MDPVLRRSPACHSACRTQVDVRVCSLSYPCDILKQFLVIKTFPNVSLFGVRNSLMVQRVSLTPSQALSRPTSSYVFSPLPLPPLTYPFFHPKIAYPPPLLYPPGRATFRSILGLGTKT